MLCLDDFFVLEALFIQEVQHNLPVPASVAFRVLVGNGVPPTFPDTIGEGEEGLSVRANVTEPGMHHNRLMVPLVLPSEQVVAVELSEIDPAILRKMASSWLRELQALLLERFSTMRLGYVDPETELYNRRAASLLLAERSSRGRGCFFLLHVSFQRRTAVATASKYKEVADLLPALTQGLCFSFGYGVFGVYCNEMTREQALKSCHYWQHHFKREGMRRIQIGFSLDTTKMIEPAGLENKLWLALAVAEKRGPFGIFDVASLTGGAPPFSALPTDYKRTFRRATQKRPSFFLAAVLFHGDEGLAAIDTDFDWLKSIFNAWGMYLGQEDRHVLVLLTPTEDQDVRQAVAAMHQKCQDRFAPGAVSIGVACWPFLDFTKLEVAANCQKALFHAAFLGPGNVVYFDHISLNVSGDVYFEEGDYRMAIKEYRRGLLRQPGDVNLLNSLGVALVECGQERKAAVCFREVLRRDPDNDMALTNLGNVLQELGDKNGALGCYERALINRTESDAGKQDLFLSTTRMYTDFGLHEQAVALLERWRVVAGSDRDFRLFRLLGQNYMETGRPDEAMVACQRALRLFPQDSLSLSLLGLLYVEQGQGVDVGLSLCRKALELDSFNPDHWLRLGRALLHAGDPAEALSAFRKCLALRHGWPEDILQLGRAYQALAKDRQAKRCFHRVLAMRGCSQRQAKRAQASLAELTAAKVV